MRLRLHKVDIAIANDEPVLKSDVGRVHTSVSTSGIILHRMARSAVMNGPVLGPLHIRDLCWDAMCESLELQDISMPCLL